MSYSAPIGQYSCTRHTSTAVQQACRCRLSVMHLACLHVPTCRHASGFVTLAPCVAGAGTDPVEAKRLDRALAICRKRLLAWKGPDDESIVRADMLQSYVLLLQVRCLLLYEDQSLWSGNESWQSCWARVRLCWYMSQPTLYLLHSARARMHACRQHASAVALTRSLQTL
jgi:hypothetical protein